MDWKLDVARILFGIFLGWFSFIIIAALNNTFIESLSNLFKKWLSRIRILDRVAASIEVFNLVVHVDKNKNCAITFDIKNELDYGRRVYLQLLRNGQELPIKIREGGIDLYLSPKEYQSHVVVDCIGLITDQTGGKNEYKLVVTDDHHKPLIKTRPRFIKIQII